MVMVNEFQLYRKCEIMKVFELDSDPELPTEY